MTRVRTAAAILAIVTGGGCGDDGSRTHLDIATTTSVKNSGLLGELLPAFQNESGVVVRAHATSSALALSMFEDGVVDLVLTHAPRQEAEHLARHQDWIYRKVAFNQFVVVGPNHDPARVREASDAVDAFRRIAKADVNFISRNDASGTHERETELWADAAIRPNSDRLIATGGSMVIALRHADERVGYTLSDEATFRQLAPQLDVVALFSKGSSLLNTYAVIHRRSGAAPRLANWLASGRGRLLLDRYSVAGSPAFRPWPANCPADDPDATPCVPDSR